MEPNQQPNYKDTPEVLEVIQEPTQYEEASDEGLLSKRNLILALLLFLFILFFSILAYSAKYYFDNQNSRPATVQSVPVTSSSSSSSSSSASSLASSTSSSSSVPPVVESKPGSINSDSGLLIRKDDGSLKYPNPTGPVQGSFGDKETVKIDTTKNKKEFVINGEKLSFVYATGATKEGWIAEKYVIYR
jgi:cytoskeletal protein RodZ